MRTVKLDDNVQFDALSYVWGSADQTYPVICNGQTLHVHHNLYRALPYLARRHVYPQRWLPRKASNDEMEHDFSFTRRDSRWIWKQTIDGEVVTHLQLPIWIDALCINQQDDNEKMIQVANMSQLYRKATKVWVWLGVPENQHLVPKAMDLLPAIACAADRAGSYMQQQSKTICLDDRYIQAVLRIDPQTSDILTHLLYNEWFRRVWIVQEYVLADHIFFICGQHIIFDDLLADALHNIATLASVIDRAGVKMIPDFLKKACRSSQIIELRRTGSQFLFSRETSSPVSQAVAVGAILRISYLLSFYSRCYLPQDRLFGILGILDSDQYHALGVDLFSIKNTSELYVNFAAATLPLALSEAQCNLDSQWAWLNLACLEKTSKDLPSWVPDLHSVVGKINVKPLTSGRSKASSQQCMVSRGRQLHEMQIRGTLLDAIGSTCTTVPSRGHTDSDGTQMWLIKLCRWEAHTRKVCTGLGRINHLKDIARAMHMELEDPYWRSLIGNDTKSWYGTITHKHYEAFHIGLQKFSRNSRKFAWGSFDETHTEFWRRPYVRMLEARRTLADPSSKAGLFLGRLNVIENRQLFITVKGVPGFTNNGVQKGDIICVFKGAPTPHVLRRVPDRLDEKYTLIGEAYVHGLMNGEVDSMNLDDQDIVLV